MPASNSLTPRATPYDRLLYSVIPDSLRLCGCSEAADKLGEVLATKPPDRNQLIDALDEASDLVLRNATYQDHAAATRSEQVSAMARHLSEHEARHKSPIVSGQHLKRAMKIAEQLEAQP